MKQRSKDFVLVIRLRALHLKSRKSNFRLVLFAAIQIFILDLVDTPVVDTSAGDTPDLVDTPVMHTLE